MLDSAQLEAELQVLDHSSYTLSRSHPSVANPSTWLIITACRGKNVSSLYALWQIVPFSFHNWHPFYYASRRSRTRELTVCVSHCCLSRMKCDNLVLTGNIRNIEHFGSAYWQENLHTFRTLPVGWGHSKYARKPHKAKAQFKGYLLMPVLEKLIVL